MSIFIPSSGNQVHSNMTVSETLSNFSYHHCASLILALMHSADFYFRNITRAIVWLRPSFFLMADGIEFERVALLALDSDCMSTPFIGCSISGGYRHGARVSVSLEIYTCTCMYVYLHIHKYVYVIDSIKWLDSERRCCRCCWRFTLPLRCHFKRVIDLTVDWVSWQLALWQLLLMGMSRYRVKRRTMLLLLLLLLVVTGAVLGFFSTSVMPFLGGSLFKITMFLWSRFRRLLLTLYVS